MGEIPDDRLKRLDKMLEVSSIIENAPSVIAQHYELSDKFYAGSTSGNCGSSSNSGNSSNSASGSGARNYKSQN